MVLSKNEFGELVKAYRSQRGWTQEELAARWGHSRAYVSQIEKGTRKLDSATQVTRLADILDIPAEKLAAIGRGVPERKIHPQEPSQSDDALLQMLLSPGRDMVKLSWMVWFADKHPTIEDNLRNLVANLDHALTTHYGQFVKPAQQLLAYAHQMIGKIAFDRLDYATASGHFTEMIELGEELNDPDIISAGMIQQGDILRKRGRFESAFRFFEMVKPFADVASPGIKGMRYQLMARAFSLAGREQDFLRAINNALEIAEETKDTIDNLANQFNFVECLQEQAQGYTILWHPEKALQIYKETDTLKPFRPLRDLGSYSIVKAQAHTYAGDLDKGVEYALRGLQLATEYQSKRHIARVDGMYSRLRVLPIGQDKRMDDIKEALANVHEQQATW